MPELLNAEQIAAALADLEGWTGGPEAITRTAKLPSFLAAIQVVDQTAVAAEELDHHPDIDIRWRTLTFVCTTHSAGGVTTFDLRLARRINDFIAAAD